MAVAPMANLVAFRAILVVGICLGLAGLSFLELWRTVDRRIFDLYSTLAAPQLDQTDVVLVTIDEPSFAEIGLQWPWPRDLHAALVDSLSTAGARVIAFDVVFAEPSSRSADDALADAIRRAGNVILAGDEVLHVDPHAAQIIRVEPLAQLSAAGAMTGIAAVTLDSDGVLRRLPARADSFARVVLDAAGIAIAPRGTEGLVQFLGPAGSYPAVSYYQALAPQQFLPPDLLRGRVALIGLAVKAAPDPGARQADAFATPFTLTTGELTAGVEVQGTMIDNLRHGLAIAEAPWSVLLAAIMAAAVLGSLCQWQWQPLRSSAIALGLIAAAGAGSWFLLSGARVWLPPGLPALAVFAAYLGEGGRAFGRERAERRRIKLAFGRYLSPALVEQLAADPSRLKLGGETKTLTILFCDVRGFTTISETFKNDPAGLTRLINNFLTPMTDVILAHGGTIDKYIGDAIMAFWNAPLDDSDHAVNACRASLAMFKALGALNERLTAEAARGRRNALVLDIGIGLNTGPVVVGNMGSERRFDYSVLGDAVNLASRLEGQSKTYGVGIVVGETTATAVASAGFALLELDLIAVKGKSEAVRIFTLRGDPDLATAPQFRALADRHAAALAAYRRQDWDAAHAAFAACRDLAPDLSVLYGMYFARIEQFRVDPPGPDWNGVYVATSK